MNEIQFLIRKSKIPNRICLETELNGHDRTVYNHLLARFSSQIPPPQ
jgi:hypothetical protein